MSGRSLTRWWKGSAAHEDIYAEIRSLRSSIDERDARWRRLVSTYLNRDVTSWTPGATPGDASTWRNYLKGEKRLALNPSANCIKTLAARIASQKIRPQFLPSSSGADAWELRRKARGMQRAVEGEWYRERLYRKASSVFFDAGILGMGAVKGYIRDGRPRFERVWPGYLYVDEDAFLTTPPTTIYQVAYPPADSLIAELGSEHKDAIEAQIGHFSAEGLSPGYTSVSDIVEVVEAWHLRSSDTSADGKRALVINGTTLALDDWTWDRLPFAFLRWTEPVIGFFPQGAVEDAEPMQRELNKLLLRIQDAMHLYSNAKTYAPVGSIKKEHLRNVTGDIVEYNGNVPPTVNMPTSVSSEAFNQVWQLYGKIFEAEGVSQLSATSQKPAGIESGIALRTLQDTETGRHALLAQAWEDFFIDIADLTVHLLRDAAADGYKPMGRDDRGSYAEVDWSDVDMARDAYELQVFPTSYLPATPAGRLATVQDLMTAGLIDPKQALQLLQMPDLDQFSSLANAAVEDIDRQIGVMLERGEEQRPEPYQDLQLGLARVTSALLRARQDGVPEDRIRLLLEWIEEAQTLLQPEEPPASAAPPGPGMMPPPGPAGPPPEGPPELAAEPPMEPPAPPME